MDWWIGLGGWGLVDGGLKDRCVNYLLQSCNDFSPEGFNDNRIIRLYIYFCPEGINI